MVSWTKFEGKLFSDPKCSGPLLQTLPLKCSHLYQPGELEGGRRRATDPIWSLNVYEIEKIMIKPDAPVIYYLFDGPKRWFVREELLVVPPDTQLPPAI